MDNTLFIMEFMIELSKVLLWLVLPVFGIFITNLLILIQIITLGESKK